MTSILRLRIRRAFLPIPRFLWQRQVLREARSTRRRLEFMTLDHHRVRNYCVTELRTAQPLEPARIAADLDLSVDQVNAICAELEREKTFVFRGDGENVSWAYPVTAEVTPHYVAYKSGEPIYAA